MFKYEKASATTTVFLAPTERVVEFTPGGVDVASVARVLSLAVDGKVLNTNSRDGYVEVEGRADFRMLYLDVDGLPQGVNYNADFTVRLDGDVTADDTATATVSVIEANASVRDTLTLSAVVNVSASAVKRGEEEMLCDAENCYKTEKTVILPSFVAAKTAVIPVEDEVQVGEVGKVLFLDARCALKNATVATDEIALDVGVYATVTYTENGEIKTAQFDIPATEELILEGVREGDLVSADVNLKNSRIVLAGVTGENILRFEADINARLRVVRMNECEIVDDIFMLTNEIQTEYAEKSVCRYAGSKISEEKIEGTVSLPNGTSATAIIAVPASTCYVAKAVEGADGGAVVEGVVSAEIIYSYEDGLGSVRAEIPFSLNIDGEFGEHISAEGTVACISAKLRRDNEIDIAATLIIKIDSYEDLTFGYISAVTVGDEKEVNTSGLSLYIASEGDGMWELCRALTATPEAILEQNPTLSFPLHEGEKAVFFRAL